MSLLLSDGMVERVMESAQGLVLLEALWKAHKVQDRWRRKDGGKRTVFSLEWWHAAQVCDFPSSLVGLEMDSAIAVFDQITNQMAIKVWLY